MPVVKVCCSGCRNLLLKHNKAGCGALVKLSSRRVTADHTAGALACPSCDSQFAREAIISGQHFRKLLGGKVLVKGGVSAR
jgi:hypothetical protein